MRLLNGQSVKAEHGTTSAHADCAQSVGNLMLLVGLLIVDTFNFLQGTASQAYKQATRACGHLGMLKRQAERLPASTTYTSEKLISS